jgi:hypothetical protein
MSVGILYCEGGRKAYDQRVLQKILIDICLVKRSDTGHPKMPALLERERESNPCQIIMAIRDRDHTATDFMPHNAPVIWIDKQNNNIIGWYWERVELENYLLDPVVVTKALGRRISVPYYREMLEESANMISMYAAARRAVSRSLPEPFPSHVQKKWGQKAGNNHFFPIELDENGCRDYIRETASQHRQAHELFEEKVFVEYDSLLPSFRPDGEAFTHFLTYYAGKDLLWGMYDKLQLMGYDNPTAFLEAVMSGIDNSDDDIWTWLPEWTALREASARVDSYS